MRQWLLVCAFFCIHITYPQYTLKGIVVDSQNVPIVASHIDLSSLCTTTDANGVFALDHLSEKLYTLRIQKEGYFDYVSKFVLDSDATFTFVLNSENEELEEIIIVSQHNTAQNQSKISQQQILKNYAGSLAQSIAHSAGVDAMSIGAQNAKPTMRGLGFTRLAVVENGVKQEGQQWGADHGLELDAFQTEQVEVIKGVGTIEYGSDAIAGVIKINNELLPAYGVHGQAMSMFNSNNKSYGVSANVSVRKKDHFLKLKTSYVDYADFKVPTDKIVYLNTIIPLYDGILTNTAGDEKNISMQWGYTKNSFTSILSLSHFASTSGFFAGAHGIPSVDKTKPDGNSRNVGFPKQLVNHTKVNYHAKWDLLHATWDFKTAYQNNCRKELSRFHSHYPNQPIPENQPDVELDFLLQTWDSQVTYSRDWSVHHTSKFGLSYNYQTNGSAGYSFLLPEYEKSNASFYVKHQWNLSNEKLLEFGGRIDYAKLDIEGYFDKILFEYLNDKGYSFLESNQYAQRSKSLSKDFLQGNFSVGYAFHPLENWHSTLTLASNFRFPTAMELSANGIHHGAFRHEQGNSNLKPEQGLALDWNQVFRKQSFKIDVSTYAYYFSNYIFLKPSGNFSLLPHGGQVYQYDQSAALLAGIEWDASYQWKQWNVNWVMEFLYNQQLNTPNNYPLPFSTPANSQLSIGYAFKTNKKISVNELTATWKSVSVQNRIAQNESVTNGYNTFNLQWNSAFTLKSWKPEIQIGIQNILNTKYYQHNSFYRALEIPGMARAIQCLIKIPF